MNYYIVGALGVERKKKKRNKEKRHNMYCVHSMYCHLNDIVHVTLHTGARIFIVLNGAFVIVNIM